MIAFSQLQKAFIQVSYDIIATTEADKTHNNGDCWCLNFGQEM